MCEFESPDATKITSASADSRISFSWMIVSLWVRTLCFLLGSYQDFSVFSLSSLSLFSMLSSSSTCVGRVNRSTRNATERRREQHYCEALAFSRHSINVVFDEESMKPDRLTEAPENASFYPSTMRERERVSGTRNRLAKMTIPILHL